MIVVRQSMKDAEMDNGVPWPSETIPGDEHRLPAEVGFELESRIRDLGFEWPPFEPVLGLPERGIFIGYEGVEVVVRWRSHEGHPRPVHHLHEWAFGLVPDE